MLRELCARMIRSLPRRVGVISLGVGAVAASGLILYGPARSEMGGGAVALMLLHLGLGLPLGVWGLVSCPVCLRPARWPLSAATGGGWREGRHRGGGERRAAYGGAAGCQGPASREWLAPAHGTAGSAPFYQASRRSFAARSGAPATRWCAGCHEPTSLLGEEG